MSLPVFGIFLKKLYNDPLFAAMQSDEFERPANFNIELDCDKAKRENSRRGGYIRERY